LRLHELAGVVDKFVLVEATETHTNKPKPLHYQENRARFSAFHDKIIHIVADDMPKSSDAWIPENFQRNCIGRGLKDCRPDDFVLVSDLDEIPRASVVKRMTGEIPFHDNFLSNAAHGLLNSGPFKSIFHRRGLRRRLRNNHPFVWRFKHTYYRHYLNCRSLDPAFFFGTRMMRFRDFSGAEEMRHSGYKTVEDAGWHFSWMGGVQRIQEKLAAYAHQERNLPQNADAGKIKDALDKGQLFYDQGKRHQFVPLDDSFPRYVLENREKFSAWIKPL
jgi:Glycosyltransferase family 17